MTPPPGPRLITTGWPHWPRAAAAAEREKLNTAHAEMIEALGEGLMAYGPPAAAGARRVRGIEQEIARAGEIERDLEKRRFEESRLAKLADLSLCSAREVWRGQVERRSLEELIEATLRPDTGPRKP